MLFGLVVSDKSSQDKAQGVTTMAWLRKRSIVCDVERGGGGRESIPASVCTHRAHWFEKIAAGSIVHVERRVDGHHADPERAAKTLYVFAKPGLV